MEKYEFIPMIKQTEIISRIEELAEKISNDYKGQNLHCVCVLKGAVIFMSQLLKRIKHDNLTIDYISVSSYGEGGRESSGIVKILKDVDGSIEGKNVLIVEDILDTGNTLDRLIAIFKTRNPNSIKICTLLDKPSRRLKPVNPDYVGFTIDNVFVLGYGLDFDEYYRNLPYVAKAVEKN